MLSSSDNNLSPCCFWWWWNLFHWLWEDVSICHWRWITAITSLHRTFVRSERSFSCRWTQSCTKGMTLQAEGGLDRSCTALQWVPCTGPTCTTIHGGPAMSTASHKASLSALSVAQSQVFADPRSPHRPPSTLGGGGHVVLLDPFHIRGHGEPYCDLQSWAHQSRQLWARS